MMNGARGVTTGGDSMMSVDNYNFPSMLHFLKSEFRRFESEREIWEIERVEYESKIERLESMKQLNEKLHFDLLRRVKMLEFALRSERLKYVETIKRIQEQQKINLKGVGVEIDFNQTIPVPSIEEELLKEHDDDFDPRSLFGDDKNKNTLREYLEDLNCSEAWTLLVKTSNLPAEVMNNHMGKEMEEKIKKNNMKTQKEDAISSRKRYSLSSIFNTPDNRTEDTSKKEEFEEAILTEDTYYSTKTDTVVRNEVNNQEQQSELATESKLSSSRFSESEKSNPIFSFDKAYEKEPKKEKKKKDQESTMWDFPSEGSSMADKGGSVRKPKSKKQKRSSKSKSFSVSSVSSKSSSSVDIDRSLMWTPEHTLSSHLDGVRSIAFHDDIPVLFSASEDSTVKMWNVESLDTKNGTNIHNPVHTYRGHKGCIFSVCCSKDKLFSAGEDGDIRMWYIPDYKQSQFTNHGIAVPYNHGKLEGHSDCIWSLSLNESESLLLSCSSDSTIRLWNYDKGMEATSLNIEGENGAMVPTCVTFFPNDKSKCLVTSRDSYVCVLDLESGKTIWKSKSEEVNHEETDSINSFSSISDNKQRIGDQLLYSVVGHSTLPLAITSSEDKLIRFYDLNTGKNTSSMVGHKDAVTCLSLDPNNEMHFASCGHDRKVRFWDIGMKKCIQDISVHRDKYDESIHSIAFSKKQKLFGSSGADSFIKIYK